MKNKTKQLLIVAAVVTICVTSIILLSTLNFRDDITPDTETTTENIVTSTNSYGTVYVHDGDDLTIYCINGITNVLTWEGDTLTIHSKDSDLIIHTWIIEEAILSYQDNGWIIITGNYSTRILRDWGIIEYDNIQLRIGNYGTIIIIT